MSRSKYLSIYLNDHLAALAALRAVARRSRRSNRGTDLGRYLAQVTYELGDAIDEIERVAVELGIRRDPLKRAAAWAAEKAGRLKLNGHFLRYSPLSRVLELEGLLAGAELELAGWRTLAGVTGRDLSGLASLCEQRWTDLARHHSEAAKTVLRGASSPTR